MDDDVAEVVSYWGKGSRLARMKDGRYRVLRGSLTDAEYIAQLENHVISKHNALILTWKNYDE